MQISHAILKQEAESKSGKSMPYGISIDKMSLEEKLQTMEAIWEDLCQSAGSLKSPDWHQDILREREDTVREGQDEFVEWEAAKKDIKNQLK